MNEPLTHAQFEEMISAKLAVARRRFRLERAKIFPRIGDKYADEPVKVLICGESFYEDEEYRQRMLEGTEDVAGEAIRIAEDGPLRIMKMVRDVRGEQPRMTGHFHRRVFRYLTGRTTGEALRYLSGEATNKSVAHSAYLDEWQRWAFWELIQERLPQPKPDKQRPRPTKKQWLEGEEALREIMSQIDPQPNLVLGLGYEMGDELRATELLAPCAKLGKDRLFVYQGPTAAGTRTYVLFAMHPAYRKIGPFLNRIVGDVADTLALIRAERGLL